MAAETLSVRKDGAWKPVINPWVYDTSGIAAWKRIHKVHVRSGNAWKLAHKTNYDDYPLLHNNTYNDPGSQLSRSITVGAGIHYWEVIIIGHGGGSGGIASVSNHYTCGGSPSPSDNLITGDISGGRWGGAGGYARAIFEVQQGSVMTFHNAVQSGAPANESLPPTGGAAFHRNTTNSGSYNFSLNEVVKGGDGGASNIIFRTDTGYPHKTAIAIDVNGGTGGSGGYITCTSRCYSFTDRRGYNFSLSNTGGGTSGTASIVLSGGTTSELQTTTTGGGVAGADAPSSGAGLAPLSYGSVQIKQYGIST
tara:strand:+ start:1570 stop:2493 length:924 start_codon:yes stop_codon:yes gene_type:complete